ncbi:protein FAM217A [Heteronotia binoei]|uniref:protein FAM217A n=1 Tax=Heteronotia binoei TaxID=13085 RepID=UPI00292E766E|nr:protein FAM217A [Heteronotia binoei]XP_060098975.1 protein FAM217A [Heteronotia binoei]
MEKNDFVPGIYGTSLPLSCFTHQIQHNCGLDSDGSTQNKLNSPGDKVVTGGVHGSTFYKDHYKAAVEQLAALSLSKNTRTAQLNPNSSKQGAFHTWSYLHHQGNNSVSRDFSKPSAEKPSSSNDTPTTLNTNPTLVGSHPANKYQSVSYPGTQQTENCSRNGDGDFFKKTHETFVSSHSEDTLSVTKLNLKTGDSHGEDKLLAKEKDASEGAKNRSVLLKYLKKANLNLRPEPIEDLETSSTECDTGFSYPDFLPAPYNTLDLQKLSLSKGDDWKLSFEPPLQGSLDKLLSRLVEMERLQHLTILKERTKELSASPTTSNRPSSTKDVYQLKQLKSTDFLCPQAAFDGDFHNFGSCMKETDISKWTCHHCHNKWNSGPVLPLRSKHLQAPYNKSTKAPVIVDSGNIAARKSLSCSRSSTRIHSTVKKPSRNTPAVFSLAGSESSKCKLPRNRKKPCRNNIALMSKPFSSHRLKCLSVLAKAKQSQVDHQ